MNGYHAILFQKYLLPDLHNVADCLLYFLLLSVRVSTLTLFAGDRRVYPFVHNKQKQDKITQTVTSLFWIGTSLHVEFKFHKMVAPNEKKISE